MRRHRMVALLAAFALAACTGETGDADESADAVEQAPAPTAEMAEDQDIAPTGEATGLPAGYQVRLDRASSAAADYRVASEDGGLHVQTGPAGILYRAEDAVNSGDYTVSATFTEIGAPPNHREAFGLFIGGQDLQGQEQQYTYFLVRADGRYLIKRRAGSETPNVSDGWVQSDAVNGAAEGGEVTNALSVAVTGEQVRFSVNGTQVATLPATELNTHGIAGVRINHNLNVRVDDFSVEQ